MKLIQYSHTKLSREEEKAIFNEIRAGDQQARDDFVLNNLGLVLSTAKRLSYLRPAHVDMEDVTSAGYVGLMRAVDRYDPERSKFSTWAVYWIEAEIREFLYQSHSGSGHDLGYRLAEAIYQVNRLQNVLYQELQRIPTTLEQESDERFQHLAQSLSMSVFELLQAKHDRETTISSDFEINDSSGNVTTLKEFIPDRNLEVEDKVDKQDLINYLLSHLDERERFIIIHYFGLNDTCKLNLEQIGSKLDLTASRILQIKKNAVTKMKLLATEDENVRQMF